jgi:hypothetical protein
MVNSLQTRESSNSEFDRKHMMLEYITQRYLPLDIKCRKYLPVSTLSTQSNTFKMHRLLDVRS